MQEEREPVPPGFEDEVQRNAEIQMAIDKYKGNALIGLEYAVEIYEVDGRELAYFCVLCDKRGDPLTIMQHWTSFSHRLKYLAKHYPSTVREFNSVKNKPNYHYLMIKIVQSIAESIEQHHGRLTLSVCSAEDFRRMKDKIVEGINAKHHHSEQNGPNFIKNIYGRLWETLPSNTNMEQTLQKKIETTKRMLSENSLQRSLYPARSDLDEISSDSDGENSVKKSRKREQSLACRIVSREHHSPYGNEKEREITLPTPKELSLQASHIAQERYKWEKYRCMLEIQLKQMEKLRKDYEKNPETHPLYPDEWKKFWNRRYKELQAEKIVDPNMYDYKPEWILFWTKRIKELFSAEIEKKKKEIKLKLNLPENAEEKVDELKEKYKVQISRGGVGVNTNTTGSKGISNAHKEHNRSHEKRISDVIDISDDDGDDDAPRHRRRRSRSNSRSRSHRSRSFSPPSHSRDYKRRRDSRSRSPPHSSSSYHRRHGNSNSSLAVRAGYPRSSASEEYYGASSRARYLGGPPSSSSYNSVQHPHYRVMDPHQYPKYEHSPSPPSNKASTTKEEIEPEDDGPQTVVAVLRLLTALEDNLGSLGPKVVDLLGKALALEKVKANSADDLLTNEDNCILFETIKEKLKGLLIADVIEEPQKIRAVKKAIRNIAAVIHQLNSKGDYCHADGNSKNSDTIGGGNDKKDASMGAGELVSGNGANIKSLPFDRQVIATKLAAALVMQGREDVTTDDMDKLIYLFILMVKLSKDKYKIDGKPLHTRDILTELGLPVPAAPIVKLPAFTLPSSVDDFLQSDAVSTLVQQVEEEMSNDTSERDSKMDSNPSMLESLTDSDLQTLLQNFKHLSTEEQHHLVALLKKLETTDPMRVEKFRKYINLTELTDAASSSSSSSALKSKESSIACFNHRINDSPPLATVSGSKEHAKQQVDAVSKNDNDRRSAINVSNPNKFHLDDDDDDDDYNFDDVFKSASSKVDRLSAETSCHSSKPSNVVNASSKIPKSASNVTVSTANVPASSSSSSSSALTFNPATLNISLKDTQNLIASLMGSLKKSNANQNSRTNSIPTVLSNSATVQSTNSNSFNQRQQQVPVPHQQQHRQPPAMPHQNNMPHYQQQMQQTQYPGAAGVGYNQMDNSQAYYNAMGGYNNAGVGYGSYQQWSGGSQQQSGMQNFRPQ